MIGTAISVSALSNNSVADSSDRGRSYNWKQNVFLMNCKINKHSAPLHVSRVQFFDSIKKCQKQQKKLKKFQQGKYLQTSSKSIKNSKLLIHYVILHYVVQNTLRSITYPYFALGDGFVQSLSCSVERNTSTDQNKQHDPTAPNINRFSVRLSFNNFRRHKMWCSDVT